MSNELLKKEEKIQFLIVEIQKETINCNSLKVAKLKDELRKEQEGYDELVLDYFKGRV